jgi:hypothetical protein
MLACAIFSAASSYLVDETDLCTAKFVVLGTFTFKEERNQSNQSNQSNQRTLSGHKWHSIVRTWLASCDEKKELPGILEANSQAVGSSLLYTVISKADLVCLYAFRLSVHLQISFRIGLCLVLKRVELGEIETFKQVPVAPYYTHTTHRLRRQY